MTILAITRSDVPVTLHILAVVITFGGALAYPLWFRMIRRGTPQERAFFHRAQANLGKFLIVPGIIVIFGTGAYLARNRADNRSDGDEGWRKRPLPKRGAVLSS